MQMSEVAPNISGFPTRPYAFDDLRLGVGNRLQLEVPGQEKPVAAKLLGYLKGGTLMVRAASVSAAGGYRLHEGDPLRVRGFSGRIAFTFGTVIEKVRYIPYAYFHLQFPSSIQGTEIRHAERVRVNLPARVVGANGHGDFTTEATIANISIDGAMLISHVPLGQVGDRISLIFRFWILPNEYEVNMRIAAVVRSVAAQTQSGASDVRYGVKFEGLRSTETILLQNLIYQRMRESPDTSV